MTKPGKIKVTPIDYVIHAFSGVRPLARRVKRYPSTISRLRRRKDRDGNIGLIPDRLQRAILRVVQQGEVSLRVPITSEHLVNGGEIDVRRESDRLIPDRRRAV